MGELIKINKKIAFIASEAKETLVNYEVRKKACSGHTLRKPVNKTRKSFH